MPYRFAILLRSGGDLVFQVAGLVIAAVHAVSYLMLSGAINAVGHTSGRRVHPNSATNVQLLALITAGEPDVTHQFQVGGKGSFGSRRSGTGMGLAIARDAASRAGGVVTLHDGPDGLGLLFRYTQKSQPAGW